MEDTNVGTPLSGIKVLFTILKTGLPAFVRTTDPEQFAASFKDETGRSLKLTKCKSEENRLL